MGEGLKRVAKECGGLMVEAKGETVTYDANGKVIAVKRTAGSQQRRVLRQPATAYRDAEGWVLMDSKGDPTDWPADWPSTPGAQVLAAWPFDE